MKSAHTTSVATPNENPLPICTLSALAACALSGQGGSRVYGEIKARDLCVTAPILLSAFCLACSR
ncbi:hypothetical protein ACNF4B_03615 [Neisseria meningitidis]|uniref:hypothetical protein n=1 Tax=Neisseria meningitidis TaxID=487 RepID=UPI0030B4AF9C